MKISIVMGTRPEAIKLAPVVLALRRCPWAECRVCVTAQHRQMLDQVLSVFGIHPDVDLDLMRPGQTLAELTARALEGLDAYFTKERPDAVLVQGDTTTVFAGALAAFYHRIPVGHVEAGLRTNNLYSPWPEEANRQMASRLARWHFAPTARNRSNLLAEGIRGEDIHVTGNTVIDALLLGVGKAHEIKPAIEGLPFDLYQVRPNRRIVVVTGHRRENFGSGFEQICLAIDDLAKAFPDVDFIYPVHLNPQVREPVNRILGSRQRGNIHLLPPLEYLPFLALLEKSAVVLTDSGGVQEEAPSLGKPVLVMRDTTERPEAVEAGAARLVGTNRKNIVGEVTVLLESKVAYEKMANAINPYGDGHATERILSILEKEI